MKIKNISLNQASHAYKMAVFLSSFSVLLGILRELVIVGIYGFTKQNDQLQLYLSIFYTVGLSIDAMRLSCLNLYTQLTLGRLLILASCVSLPFVTLVSIVMNYSANGLDPLLLFITMIGCFLNLIAALLITYLQRNNVFLPAQFISIMPNFILIPGILICYYFSAASLMMAIIYLSTLIPIVQCILLLSLKRQKEPANEIVILSWWESLMVFIRHFAAITGEQAFQIIARTAFYHYGTGYLSVYSIIIRIYAAVRFVLIDSFIGAKLANWNKQSGELLKLLNSTIMTIALAFAALLLSIKVHNNLFYASIQMVIILIIGFYFSTLVRLIYFKINHHENNSLLVIRFASYEIIAAFFAFLLTQQLNYPLFAILWIGYIAKPLAQLFLLRKRYHLLTAS